MSEVSQKNIAVLATHGFEQIELTEPVRVLRLAGANVSIVSLQSGEIQGMNHDKKGDMTKVDIKLSEANPEHFDALVLPGGVANPDTLRTDKSAISFVEHFVDAHKPIGAICHGPWTLIEAHAVRGKNMTSWPSLKTDLTNAGAHWLDQSVVVDENLVTSRNPGDLKDFNRELLAIIGRTPSRPAEKIS